MILAHDLMSFEIAMMKAGVRACFKAAMIRPHQRGEAFSETFAVHIL